MIVTKTDERGPVATTHVRSAPKNAVAAALDAVGGGACMKEITARRRKNREYLSRSHTRLTKSHPDEWVAISRCRVLAHADDLEDLTERVERIDDEIERRSVILHLLMTGERTYIL